jgi:hypothetical protein
MPASFFVHDGDYSFRNSVILDPATTIIVTNTESVWLITV